MSSSKDLESVILSTVHINPELQQRAGLYFNRNEDGYNLFAEQRGSQEQVYIFNMYGNLYGVLLPKGYCWRIRFKGRLYPQRPTKWR